MIPFVLGKEENVKRIGFVGLIVLLAAAFSLPAFAWQFSMKGDWEWRYRYWTRTWNNDIFGTMDSNAVDLGINHLVTFPSGQTTNRVSSVIGVMAGQNRFWSEMSLTELRMTVFPKIKINKAIDLEASINLTSLGIWSDGEPYKG